MSICRLHGASDQNEHPSLVPATAPGPTWFCCPLCAEELQKALTDVGFDEQRVKAAAASMVVEADQDNNNEINFDEFRTVGGSQYLGFRFKAGLTGLL